MQSCCTRHIYIKINQAKILTKVVFLPSAFTGAINGVLSFKSPGSLPLSPRKRNLLPWMVPCKQISAYHPELAFFLFPVPWHWLYPDSTVLYRVTIASTLAMLVLSLLKITCSMNDLSYKRTYWEISDLSKPIDSSKSFSWTVFMLSKSFILNFLSFNACQGKKYLFLWMTKEYVNTLIRSCWEPRTTFASMKRLSFCPSVLYTVSPLERSIHELQIHWRRKNYTGSPSNSNDNCSTWMSHSVKNWWNNPMKAVIASATICFLT